jgi:hypothetical protein
MGAPPERLADHWWQRPGRQILAETQPIAVSLGRVFYHPEAITPLVDPVAEVRLGTS